MVKAVFVTAPRDEAHAIARTLVEEGLSACVNKFPVDSVYRWKGKVEEAEETGLLIKTADETVDELVKRVRELHSYELPEILVIDVGGDEEYLSWVRSTTTEGA